MNTSAENDCSIAENIEREEDTVEVYHFPVAVKQEIVATLPQEQQNRWYQRSEFGRRSLKNHDQIDHQDLG